MSYKLDPKILSKLRAFAQRRRKLILIRGLASGLAMLLATMMLVAAVDYFFVLPDAVRWGLSGAAYLAVIVTEWRSCLQLLAHAPGPRRLARLVEHAEPKLREDLLSAVELGTGDDRDAIDSAQFRALLQTDVAARMESLDMERLLPVALLRRYLAIAAGVVAVLVVAFILTGGQLGTLLKRALLPLANVARVSKVQVEIVAPNPADRVVAQGDTEPLVVQLKGQRANKAFLETFTKTGGRELIPMTPAGGDRFTSTIQVAREDVQYRVRAGDAITRKYQLSSVARPHVVRFDKSYTYPAYSRAGMKRVVEEHGDLAALEGSEVELRLETSQKIKEGELRVEQGKKSYAVKLAQEGSVWIGKVPLSASGIYRVHLVSATSGFENKFSPEYELRAEPDLVPEVELTLPKQDLIMPANGIVDVLGVATDDQSLAKVSQLVKINDGPWKEVVLVKDPGPKARVELRWDLYEEKAKAGDSIAMKLLAVDLKGNRGESRPLQLTITASGFETKRMQTLQSGRALYETLRELRASGEALEKQGNEAREQFERLGENDAQRKQVVVSAAAKLAEFDQKLSASWTQLIATLKLAPAGHESGDLVMLGRWISKMHAGSAQPARAWLDAIGANPAAPFAREQMRETADMFVRAGQRGRMAEEVYRQILACDELDVLAENMSVVNQEQERLAELAANSGEDAQKWAQLAPRMRVVRAETKTLEDMMLPLAGRAAHKGDMESRLKRSQKKLQEQRTVVERIAAANGKELLAPTLNFAKTVADTARGLMDLRRDVGDAPGVAFTQMLQDVGPTWAVLEKLRIETDQLTRNAPLGDARAPLVAARWESKAATFKGHGDAEEARVMSDTYFVNDVRSTTLALQAMQAGGLENIGPQLLALDKSFRLLESGHNLSEVVDGLGFLSTSERWELVASRARTSNPRDWDWLQARLLALPDELGRTQLDEERRGIVAAAQKLLRELPGSQPYLDLDKEMRERGTPDHLPVRASADVEKVAAMVKQALDLLRKPMEEARKDVAAMTPKLGEIMAQLAKEAEALKAESQEQAAKIEEKKPDAAQADAQQELARQEKLNEKVDALKDALRADANKQDILKQESREKARDADDALAMLKEPPKKSADALAEAAQQAAPQERKESLKDAAKQQEKLADALKMLAEHYEKAEQGKAEESRAALRATEQENGVKEQLDAQFAKAGQLAQMAQKSPEELLAQLEKALSQNPVMQQELSAIAKSTLNEAQTKLQQASEKENQVAQQLSDLAQPPAPPADQTQQKAAQTAADAAKEAAEAAKQAAKEAVRAAKEAVQAAKQAHNQPAAEQARNARADAEKAAASAQQAAEAAEQMAKAAPPNDASQQAQAAQAAEQAAKQAGEAAASAEDAAADAQQAEATAQQAAQKGGDKEANNEQASQKAADAAKAAQQAALAAKTAQAAIQQAAAAQKSANAQMAQNAAAQQPPQGQQTAQGPQLAQAAQQQAPIAQAAMDAGADVARAGRNEERLNNTQAGEQLQQLGKEIAETGQNEVPKAQAALAAAQQAAQAQAPVNAAKAELQSDLGKLNAAAMQTPQGQQGQQAGEAAQAPPQAAPPAGQPGDAPQAAPSPLEQTWMARTLDALDQALNSPSQQSEAGQQPGQQPGQPSQPADAASQAQAAAAAAMANAAQSAATAARSARSESPSEQPGADVSQSEEMAVSKGGVKADAGKTAYGAVGDAKGLKTGDWGKLPKKIAEQMTQGQQEGVAGEYRTQVETYYRVIAEKAKKP